MHALKKTLLLVGASLFVFGSAQAQEAGDEKQVTNEARQAERDVRRAKRENMSDEERQAMRQRRENMSDEERATMKERRQEGNAARNSQRQRPPGKGRPKRDQDASVL
jgi:hypothetical protein